ncbi:hypothetical protein GCM10011428_35210 [Streptomyces violaceus]
MFRVQLAVRAPDFDVPVAIYSRLFATGPAKLRDGYTDVAIAEPPLKLVLIEGAARQATRLGDLGVEDEDTEAVQAAATRLSDACVPTDVGKAQGPCRPTDGRAPDQVLLCVPGRIRTCDTRFKEFDRKLTLAAWPATDAARRERPCTPPSGVVDVSSGCQRPSDP